MASAGQLVCWPRDIADIFTSAGAGRILDTGDTVTSAGGHSPDSSARGTT